MFFYSYGKGSFFTTASLEDWQWEQALREEDISGLGKALVRGGKGL
jgi:hypothetical protein